MFKQLDYVHNYVYIYIYTKGFVQLLFIILFYFTFNGGWVQKL